MVLRATVGGRLAKDYGDSTAIAGAIAGGSDPPLESVWAASYLDLVRSFQPHAAALFVRHPVANFALLRLRIAVAAASSNSSASTSRSASSRGLGSTFVAWGELDGSLRLLERLFGRREALFNATVRLRFRFLSLSFSRYG
jgi:hypothetical protein